jgi:hypothetical protein
LSKYRSNFLLISGLEREELWYLGAGARATSKQPTKHWTVHHKEIVLCKWPVMWWLRRPAPKRWALKLNFTFLV